MCLTYSLDINMSNPYQLNLSIEAEAIEVEPSVYRDGRTGAIRLYVLYAWQFDDHTETTDACAMCGCLTTPPNQSAPLCLTEGKEIVHTCALPLLLHSDNNQTLQHTSRYLGLPLSPTSSSPLASILTAFIQHLRIYQGN